MLISIFLMIIISTSLTVPAQPSPRFHVEAWLPFRNREMDYCSVKTKVGMLMKRNVSMPDIEDHITLLRRLIFR